MKHSQNLALYAKASLRDTERQRIRSMTFEEQNARLSALLTKLAMATASPLEISQRALSFEEAEEYDLLMEIQGWRFQKT